MTNEKRKRFRTRMKQIKSMLMIVRLAEEKTNKLSFRGVVRPGVTRGGLPGVTPHYNFSKNH